MVLEDWTMTDELKPCPFCGGEAEVCEGGINGKMRVYGLVEHKNGCFFLAYGLPTRNQHIMESEFDTWNIRADRTCRVVRDKYGRATCSECSFVFTWEHPVYCESCGAKVVE